METPDYNGHSVRLRTNNSPSIAPNATLFEPRIPKWGTGLEEIDNCKSSRKKVVTQDKDCGISQEFQMTSLSNRSPHWPNFLKRDDAILEMLHSKPPFCGFYDIICDLRIMCNDGVPSQYQKRTLAFLRTSKREFDEIKENEEVQATFVGGSLIAEESWSSIPSDDAELREDIDVIWTGEWSEWLTPCYLNTELQLYHLYQQMVDDKSIVPVFRRLIVERCEKVDAAAL
ncbi:hypothetical protein SLS56_008804 [Neofusicoccum ribis]|uniref:Uncharacterized protein n=1 Tax=Neofusicoccum ribis TaxID=45134 RepID=A0ABR3SJ10_9PEZI